MLSFLGTEEPDRPPVTRVGDPPDIPPVLQLPDSPGYRSFVEMVVPDKGILHDVLFLCKEHQDRELPGRETKRPETVIEEDEPAAVDKGDNRPEGDIVR